MILPASSARTGIVDTRISTIRVCFSVTVLCAIAAPPIAEHQEQQREHLDHDLLLVRAHRRLGRAGRPAARWPAPRSPRPAGCPARPPARRWPTRRWCPARPPPRPPRTGPAPRLPRQSPTSRTSRSAPVEHACRLRRRRPRPCPVRRRTPWAGSPRANSPTTQDREPDPEALEPQEGLDLPLGDQPSRRGERGRQSDDLLEDLVERRHDRREAADRRPAAVLLQAPAARSGRRCRSGRTPRAGRPGRRSARRGGHAASPRRSRRPARTGPSRTWRAVPPGRRWP